MRILGVDTSCDDTSAAVTDDLTILSSVVLSQTELHEGFGGVVPEEASRAHFSRIDGVVRKALSDAGTTIDELDLIVATRGPGLLGSLLVGYNYARGLALAASIPFYGANHLFGHVYSAFLGGAGEELPSLSLIISGGHTAIGIVTREADGVRHDFRGGTLDDAVGELIDKTGRHCGLPWPAGPHVDNLALAGNKKAVRFTRPLRGRAGYDFSFSGLKSAFLRARTEEQAEDGDLFASLMDCVADCLVERIRDLADETGIRRVLFSGGVAASGFLREHCGRKLLSAGIKSTFPQRAFCTDNAAMICACGYLEAPGRTWVDSAADLEADAFASFF